jgi:hypothetical protein
MAIFPRTRKREGQILYAGHAASTTQTRNSYKIFVAEHCWKIQAGGIRERQWMAISSRRGKRERDKSVMLGSYYTYCCNEASKDIARGNSFISDYHLLKLDQRSNAEHRQY